MRTRRLACFAAIAASAALLAACEQLVDGLFGTLGPSDPPPQPFLLLQPATQPTTLQVGALPGLPWLAQGGPPNTGLRLAVRVLGGQAASLDFGPSSEVCVPLTNDGLLPLWITTTQPLTTPVLYVGLVSDEADAAVEASDGAFDGDVAVDAVEASDGALDGVPASDASNEAAAEAGQPVQVPDGSDDDGLIDRVCSGGRVLVVRSALVLNPPQIPVDAGVDSATTADAAEAGGPDGGDAGLIADATPEAG